jgi:hypothetical protein
MELRSRKLGRILGKGDARIVYEALVTIPCSTCDRTIEPGEQFTRGKQPSLPGRVITASYCNSCAPIASAPPLVALVGEPRDYARPSVEPSQRAVWPPRSLRYGQTLSSGAARLLDWLIDRSDGHICRVSNDDLVRAFRRHPTTIWKWMVELEGAGLIRRRPSAEGRVIEFALGRDTIAEAL